MRRPRLLPVLVFFLVVAAPASATVGSSTISDPADPAFRTYNADLGADAPANRLTVSGVARSTAPESDRVDVRCFWTDSGGTLRANALALRVPLGPDGSFTVTADPATLSLNSFGDGDRDDAPGVQTCRLRATPPVESVAQLDGAVLPDFTGPRVNIARFGSTSLGVRGGGNVTVDFGVGAGGLRGQAEWSSRCGAFSFRPYVNPASFSPALFPNWDCVRALLPPDAGDSASQVRVDGAPAYTGSSAPAFDFDGDRVAERPAEAAGLQVDYRRGTVTGTVTTVERGAVQRCGSPVFPPTATTCPTLLATGVELERRTVLADDGLEATISETLRSVDGAPHAVDVDAEQYVVFDNDPVFRFPGEDGFAPHGSGDQPALGLSGVPSTVLVRDAVTPDTPRQGTGAETWDARPADVRFFGQDFQYLERSTLTVPAGGAITATRVFRVARGLAEAASGARSAGDRLGAPTVTLTGPADGSVVGGATVTVTGRAADSVGVASVTVNGLPAAVAPDGSFTAAVALFTGTNVIAAVVTDAAGNTARTQRTVTASAPRCQIPRLGRSSLYGTARSKLKRAGCAAGKARRVRSSIRRGRFVRTRPAGGRVVAAGTRVVIELSDGKAKRPTRRVTRRPARSRGVQQAAAPARPERPMRSVERWTRAR